MVTPARCAWPLACTLALAACNGQPADDTGTTTDTSTATAPTTGDVSTSPPPTTSTSTATSAEATTDDPPSSTTTPTTASSTLDPGTTTDEDPTSTSDTGATGFTCPLADGPGITSESLAPTLFGDGGDPSDMPVCTTFLNPERGFHGFVDLRDLDQDTLDDELADRRTVVYGKIYIPEFRDIPLDDALLTDIAAAFDLIRASGMKVAPRFHYSDDTDEPDTDLDRILAHIDQITPLLQEHADVIVHLHAGFVGAYGEWHSSQNGLDDPGPRKQILDALLAALPETRQISVRRPSFKNDAYPGGPLTADTAHDGSPLARLGHLNDCFLASDSDFGTYQEPGEKDYAIADSPFVVVSGETCAVNPPRSECPSALDELALLHWTHINAAYHPDVLADWQTDGCYNQIACRIGYRLAVTDLRSPAAAAPGDTLPVSFDLINDGWAAPINPRPLSIILDGPTRIESPPADFDIRTAQPGETTTICVETLLPDDLPPGVYRLGLRLPDPAPALIDDPRQAIRLANDTGVEWTDGINWFEATVIVM